jgi:hypothetical protein
MLYTVGERRIYDSELAKVPILKRGAYPGYTGGTIFRSRTDAQDYLDRNGLTGYAVYGVEAAEEDVAWTFLWFGNLLADRRIVELEE